jgi:nucleotide-binding universal stress UspA family protein
MHRARPAVATPLAAPMTARSIITPVTFADECYEAVAVAAAMAAALRAELVLAGVAPMAPPEPELDTPGFDRLARQLENQQLLDRLIARRLEELTGALPRGIRARSLQTCGPVGAALVAAAREQGADLIVVPIRRERELAHLVHDHVDRYVLHHSDVPVLVVPSIGRELREAAPAA